jgi:hypothetical protein
MAFDLPPDFLYALTLPFTLGLNLRLLYGVRLLLFLFPVSLALFELE